MVPQTLSCGQREVRGCGEIDDGHDLKIAASQRGAGPSSGGFNVSVVVAELGAVRDGRRVRLSSGQQGAGSGAGALLSLRSQARLDRGGQARSPQHPLPAGFGLTRLFASRISRAASFRLCRNSWRWECWCRAEA